MRKGSCNIRTFVAGRRRRNIGCGRSQTPDAPLEQGRAACAERSAANNTECAVYSQDGCEVGQSGHAAAGLSIGSIRSTTASFRD